MILSIGQIAGIIGFLAFFPYILGTLKGTTKPNKATWIIWAVLGIIIAASYWSAGARDTAWTPIGYAFGIVVVAFLSLKYGEDGWTALDKWCLAGAGAGLVLWALTSEATLALYLTTIIDAIGGIPTIRKTYQRPESENRTAWLMFLAANSLNLLAISEWNLMVASYPVYVFVLSLIMNSLILWPRKTTVGNEVREEVIEDMVQTSGGHVKKHGMRKMSLSDLKELTGYTKDKRSDKGKHK